MEESSKEISNQAENISQNGEQQEQINQDNEQHIQDNQIDNEQNNEINKKGDAVEQVIRPKKKELYKQKMKNGTTIVVDLQFQDTQNLQELKSMANQIVFNYSENKKAQQPMNYVITSFTDECQIKKLLDERGLNNLAIQLEKQNFADIFDLNKCVYLTGDAEDEMEELDKDTIYILGGLVDHNRLKNVTLDKAKELGIRTQRFPIKKHIQLFTSEILNLNHCFNILLKLQNGKIWKEALEECIPKRKREPHSELEKIQMNERMKKLKTQKDESNEVSEQQQQEIDEEVIDEDQQNNNIINN